MPPGRVVRWKCACLLLASVLPSACASSSRHSSRRDLRLDTETVSRIRHVAAVAEAASTAAPAAAPAVAASLAEWAPALLALLQSDNAVNELEQRLVECASQAERKVNSWNFGNRSPTREECGEEVFVDGCSAPITRAMLLGKQKHDVALQCAREVLSQSWPASFSIEQRYRYYPSTRFLETVSREDEARLIAQGCTRELWRTIKPDIVLHADHDPRRAVLILDFKFPCPDTNKPQWREYGEDSAYAGSNQSKTYQNALGGRAVLISPRGMIP